MSDTINVDGLIVGPHMVRSWRQRLAEAEAALAKANEERDAAQAALVARHGGEPIALLAELDEARDSLRRANEERDAAAQWKGRAEAWEEYATHLEWCRSCAEDPEGSCWEGAQARDKARALAAPQGKEGG